MRNVDFRWPGCVRFVFDPPIVNRSHFLGVADLLVEDGRLVDTDWSTNLSPDARRRFSWFVLSTVPASFLAGGWTSYKLFEQLLLPCAIPGWLTKVDPGLADVKFTVAGNAYELVYGKLEKETDWLLQDHVVAILSKGPASFFVTDPYYTVIGAGSSVLEALTNVPWFHIEGGREEWERKNLVPGEICTDIDVWRLLDELPPFWWSDDRFVESLG